MTNAQSVIHDIVELEDRLSEPTAGVVETLGHLDGDILILGIGGKMGPTLGRMAKRASEAAGVRRKVIGVSRFSAGRLEAELQAHGLETIPCDLLDPEQLDRLPEVPNVVFMAGMKFGTTGQESLTWAMNAHLPGLVCQKFRHSRIVAFSTGNVYPLVPISQGGSVETDPVGPVGEYAMSCLGRERMFSHYSGSLGIPVALIRLSYAVELRYGVLLDIAARVFAEEPIDVTMGSLVAIWQGDANAQSLQAFDYVSSPPFVVNITGPELLSVRQLATEFGALMHRKIRFQGTESGTALVSNAQRAQRLFGYPQVPVSVVLRWVAHWAATGGAVLNKPTHFETVDGKF